MTIDISNTVNINFATAPQGLSTPNANNIALFTNDVPAWWDEYKRYINANDADADFGTGSKTSEMIKKVFAVSPNLRSGTGSLYVVPYAAVDATKEYLTTADISANVAAFGAVTDGAMIIAINNVNHQIQKIDFTGANSLAKIAQKLNNKCGSFCEVTVDSTGTKLVFTAKIYGAMAELALVAPTLGTDLTGTSYLNAATGVATAGTNASFTETLPEAIVRVQAKFPFVQVVDAVKNDETIILYNMDSIESLFNKVYIEVIDDLTEITKLGTTVKQNGYKKSHLIAYAGTTLDKGVIAATASFNASTNYSGSDTCLTMNLKELATVAPDSYADDTTLADARANGVDIYGLTSGLACYYSSKNAGGSIAFKLNLAALVYDMQTRVFNSLRKTNTKVSQTDAALSVSIDDAINKSCEQFVRNDFIGRGNTWDGAAPFGDPQNFKRLINEQGYYLYSQSTADQSQEEREQSIAPLRQLAIKTAGEVWVVNITGIVQE